MTRSLATKLNLWSETSRPRFDKIVARISIGVDSSLGCWLCCYNKLESAFLLLLFSCLNGKERFAPYALSFGLCAVVDHAIGIRTQLLTA